MRIVDLHLASYLYAAEFSRNTKSEHFSTFSNVTPCIFYIDSYHNDYVKIHTEKKEKKISETFAGFAPTITA